MALVGAAWNIACTVWYLARLVWQLALLWQFAIIVGVTVYLWGRLAVWPVRALMAWLAGESLPAVF